MRQSRIFGFPGLTEQIKVVADAIDLAAIPSKADEMHRLLDNACDSLVAVLAFCEKIGVTTEDDQVVMIALNSMLRNKDGKRFVDGVWNGKYTPTEVDNLDLVNATRLAYADQIGVSEQDVIRFEKSGANHGGFGRFVSVHCNHPGCSMSKGIGFNNPAEMLHAEQRASKEIWYCHHHREVAFASEGALADELLPVLHRIAQSPGLTQKATGAKKEELSFLESVGLIRIEQLAHGNRVMCYQIFITESGQGILNKFLISRSEE